MRLTSMSRVRSVSAIFAVFFGALLASPNALAACGNAVVEAGEDCDDGSSQNGGANSCCTASCTFANEAPDVIVGEIVGTTRWGTIGGITAFSFGTTSCNIGNCWLNWISGTAEHPVIGQNMFRLKDGRFEQVGQAWLKHGFTALTGSVCGACTPPPNGSHLGVNCSDPYSNSLNGDQTRLGPKENVDPNTGVFLYPDSRIQSTVGATSITKRLQVRNTDLDPALNTGALYFLEGQYVTHDDATAKNHPNNASYRQVTVVNNAGLFSLSLTGMPSTVREKPGIQAWKATDSSVTQTVVGAAGGQFYVSAKATSLGGGQYHYEYAVQNLNNERGAQTFTVPIPPGTVVTNVGFHDVDYHSGEVFDGTDWTPTVTASSVSWTTTSFAVNPNANALRWGTLYNFRFDANQAPGTASVVIDLFKPGSPTTASVNTVTPITCGAAPNGTACSDGNACTLADACASGACVAGGPVICTASDACHDVGTCAPATGTCSNPVKPDGAGCNDANACTQTDSCQLGVCTGANPVTCFAIDACHVAGTCVPATGVCSNPAAPDGTECSDGNACTRFDTCASGSCAGANPRLCGALDECHDVGTCSPVTGVCSNPAKPDGSPCDDGSACSVNDACNAGVCIGEGDPAPGEVDSGVAISQDQGISTITWSQAPGSLWYDVLRGLVSGLPVGPGGADEVCYESGIVGTSTTDVEEPSPGDAFWYLVVGTNTCGYGPYGVQVLDGAPSPRASATCP